MVNELVKFGTFHNVMNPEDFMVPQNKSTTEEQALYDPNFIKHPERGKFRGRKQRWDKGYQRTITRQTG